jgi:hypothetical protein
VCHCGWLSQFFSEALSPETSGTQSSYKQLVNICEYPQFMGTYGLTYQFWCVNGVSRYFHSMEKSSICTFPSYKPHKTM